MIWNKPFGALAVSFAAVGLVFVPAGGTANADALLLPVDEPFGDEAGCMRVRGDVPQTDNLIIVWPDRIERHEATCVPGGLVQRGEGPLEFEMLCSGEGESWSQTYFLEAAGDGWTVTIPEFGYEASAKACR